jgi:hypothetical protein
MRAQDYIYLFEKNLNKFCSQYRAHVKAGQPMRRVDPIWADPISNNYRDFHVTTYEVPTVEIVISENDLSALMNDLAEMDTSEYNEFVRYNKILGRGFMNDLQTYKYRQSKEEHIRNQNPGVKKAWENYQLMLKLAGNNTQ